MKKMRCYFITLSMNILNCYDKHIISMLLRNITEIAILTKILYEIFLVKLITANNSALDTFIILLEDVFSK